MQTEHAARLWRAGETASHIMTDLKDKFGADRTREAVIGKLNRIGLIGTRSIRIKRKTPEARSSVADVLAGLIARSANFGKTYPLPPDEPIPETAVTLENRQPCQCTWPVNHGSPFLFCGALKGAHRAFCDRHAFIAVRKSEGDVDAPSSLGRSGNSSAARREVGHGAERH